MKNRLLALVIALLCGALLWLSFRTLSDYMTPPEPIAPPTTTTAPTTTTTTQPPLPDNPIDFADLQAQYPEAIGYINVPGTVIDYPIMQSGPDTAEDFYLTHIPNGTEDKNGSIYIQKRNNADFTDPNTIIYGHNMASGKMFAAIHKFRDQAFFDENQYVYIYTPGYVRTYRIYSLFINEVRHLMVTYDFSTDEGYRAFLDKTLDPPSSVRKVREGILPTTDDRVITLCTCTSSRDGDGRLLLVAVLEEEQQTK